MEESTDIRHEGDGVFPELDEDVGEGVDEIGSAQEEVV